MRIRTMEGMEVGRVEPVTTAESVRRLGAAAARNLGSATFQELHAVKSRDTVALGGLVALRYGMTAEYGNDPTAVAGPAEVVVAGAIPGPGALPDINLPQQADGPELVYR